jgi:hypothetical protein
MVNRLEFITRLWYYFRTGYSTYLTFFLGAINTLVVVWYLAISNAPFVESIFAGRFIVFAVILSTVGVPLSIAIGWIHLKKSPAYKSEAEIGVESNPYYFKLAPGITLEVYGPLYLELLEMSKRVLERDNLLTPDDKKRIKNLEEKLKILNEGGYVGAQSTTYFGKTSAQNTTKPTPTQTQR